MIQNFTKEEWRALRLAITLQNETWQREDRDWAREGSRERDALERARLKAEQLAPSAR